MYGIARSVPNRYSGKLIARKKSDPVQYRNSGTRTKHAKSWLDAAFGELLRQVEYKAPLEQQTLCSGRQVLSIDQALFRMRV